VGRAADRPRGRAHQEVVRPVPVGAETAVGADGVVVIGSAGTLTRLDLADGRARWSVPVPPGDLDLTVSGTARPLIVVTARAGGRPTSTVLDPDEGRTLWSGPGDPQVTPTADALLVSAGGSSTLVDRGTGTVRWQVPLSVTLQDGTFLFEGPAGQQIVHGVVDPATGRVLWQNTEPLFTDYGAADGLVIRTVDVEPGPDTATAFDPATGAERWTRTVPRTGRGTVAPLSDDTVLITGGGGAGLGSTAVATADGAPRWRADRPLGTVVRLDGAPSVVQYDTYRLAVADGRTGAVRDTATPGFAEFAGGAVYSPDGPDVVAIGLRDLAEHWRAPAVGDLYALTAVPGGVVGVVGRSEPRTLDAYLG
jgi:outer membrane protein assembly factor BamB